MIFAILSLHGGEESTILPFSRKKGRFDRGVVNNMEEKKSRYTEAQKKSAEKYLKRFDDIKIRVPASDDEDEPHKRRNLYMLQS